MKKSVNHNVIWADLFVKALVNLGVETVCISPGSRSTPLTLAVSNETRLKKYVIVDERSSGFFALGLAKATGKPTVIITSSGTAVSELYPAVIEAYKDRIPLIVCTADRPPEMLETGANQTINQTGIYENHIRKSFNAGLPELTLPRVKHLLSLALRSVQISTVSDPGPVHINFPFRKPFEPDTYTLEIDESLFDKFYTLTDKLISPTVSYKKIPAVTETLLSKMDGKNNILFIGGYCADSGIIHKLKRFSEKFNIPVLLDATSPLRYLAGTSENFITNAQIFLKSNKASENLFPDNIILMGNSPTSNTILEFFEDSGSEVIQVSSHSDWHDPTLQTTLHLEMSAEDCCELILDQADLAPASEDWISKWKELDIITENYKKSFLSTLPDNIEPKIIDTVLQYIPDNASLFISNSLPVRDFDNFGRKTAKSLKIYTNRGASGIDGIISCAAGTAVPSSKDVYLVIGDLSFFYDLNSLVTLKKYGIPLKIILINNNGGSIFEMLPISKYTDVFIDYFRTPLNIRFEAFVNAFQGNYKFAGSVEDIKDFVLSENKDFSVLEFDTFKSDSSQVRKEFYQDVIKLINASI